MSLSSDSVTNTIVDQPQGPTVRVGQGDDPVLPSRPGLTICASAFLTLVGTEGFTRKELAGSERGGQKM